MKSHLIPYFVLSCFTLSFCLLNPPTYADKTKVFDQTQIEYGSKITNLEIEKLGQYLIKSQFTDGTSKTIKIKKKGI